MEVFEAIRTRRSIRSYANKPVEKDKLLKVLEAARLSPSAGNRQPWRFIVVTDPKIKVSLRPPHRRGVVLSAPVVIVGCALPNESFPEAEFWKIDVSIALQNLVLAAWEEGLGTCWMGVFHEEDEIKKALDTPKDVRVVAMVALGYPAEKKDPVSDRKQLEEIIGYDHW